MKLSKQSGFSTVVIGLVILVTVAAIGTGIYVFKQQTKTSPAATQSAGKSKASATTPNNTFVSSEYGFSFSYPKAYSVYKACEGSDCSTGYGKQYGYDSVSLTADQDTSFNILVPGDMKALTSAAVTQNMGNYGNDMQVRAATVFGAPGFQVDIANAPAVYYVKNNKGLILRVTAPSNGASKLPFTSFKLEQ